MKDLEEQAFYRLLGARIRELRGGRMSQEELAKRIGLKRTSMVNIEAGEQKLLVHNLFLIAEALSMRPTEIIAPLEPAGENLSSIPISEDISPDVDQWIKRGVSKAMRKNI